MRVKAAIVEVTARGTVVSHPMSRMLVMGQAHFHIHNNLHLLTMRVVVVTMMPMRPMVRPIGMGAVRIVRWPHGMSSIRIVRWPHRMSSIRIVRWPYRMSAVWVVRMIVLCNSRNHQSYSDREQPHHVNAKMTNVCKREV